MNISTNELNKDFNKELNKELISQWAYRWKMPFNPDKNKQVQEVVFPRK